MHCVAHALCQGADRDPVRSPTSASTEHLVAEITAIKEQGAVPACGFSNFLLRSVAPSYQETCQARARPHLQAEHSGGSQALGR